ncbi:hypothetical protein GCM10010532_099290 [Dactylosporangium siamense]|uniref:Uncharacterized protein n=1 Tax=Dactylosporangium siamense TaxID=685454 RepID=A0A919PYY3_9ACTN|nr:hypothetical protein Dsi01nite_092740 [Dactylosporangium siamense]
MLADWPSIVLIAGGTVNRVNGGAMKRPRVPSHRSASPVAVGLLGRMRPSDDPARRSSSPGTHRPGDEERSRHRQSFEAESLCTEWSRRRHVDDQASVGDIAATKKDGGN